jgi:protein-histidine N-methyltransferase
MEVTIAIAFDIPAVRDVVVIARQALASNTATLRVVDKEDEDDDADAVAAFVVDVLRIARVSTLRESECAHATHARVLEMLRASDGWTANGVGGTRARTHATMTIAGPGATEAHETAAHASAHRALRDALEAIDDDDDARVRAVKVRALERAMLVLEATTEAAVGAARARRDGEPRASASVIVDDVDAEGMCAWVRARGGWCALTASSASSPEGGLRGASATEDARAGEALAVVPWDALIGVEQTIVAGSSHSALCATLNQLRGLGDHVVMVIWLAATMGDAASPWARALASLPKTPSTSLAWNLTEIGGFLSPERAVSIRMYQESVRTQYDALFPALCHQVPDAFPLAIFGDYARFLLAYDIWTSYAMKVQDPETDALAEVIVPGVYLCNHALNAHSVRYTRLEQGTKAFRLELVRGVSRGEPVTISYGRLSNDDLMKFYGFSLQANPYDCLYLTPCVVPEMALEMLKSISGMCDYDLTNLPVGFQRDAPLDRALAQLRIVHAPENIMNRRLQNPEYHPFVVTDVDREVSMLQEVANVVRGKLEDARMRLMALASHAVSSQAVSAVANATNGQVYIAQETLSKLELLIADYGSRKRRSR